MKICKFSILGMIFILAVACSPAAKTIAVTSHDGKCSLEGGSRISAGEVTVEWIIKDKKPSIFGLWILSLDKDKGYQDLLDYLATDSWWKDFPPPWSYWQGDIFPAKPDSQNKKTFLFKQGRLYLICFSGESSVFADDENVVKEKQILGPVEVVK